MSFPQTIVYRDGKARIYGRTKAYPNYRVAWRAGNKRNLKSFASYGEAKEFAGLKAKELHKGDSNAVLTSAQAQEALQAFHALEAFRVETGRTVSLSRAVMDYCDATKGLQVPLTEAIEGYRSTVGAVQRIDVMKAVEEFDAAESIKTKPEKPGKRPQMSLRWFNLRSKLLRRFANTFPNAVLADLSKDQIDLFVAGLEKLELGPKSRNHHRTAVATFVKWACAKDYLPRTHRLLEASKMKLEDADAGDIEIYRPKELRAMLEAAEPRLSALLAIQGLAGLRVAESSRLTWQDVFRIPGDPNVEGDHGHIEVTSGKAKTRARRLVEICPALAAWLEPFRKCKGLIWDPPNRNGEGSRDRRFQLEFSRLCASIEIPRRRNALRHSFVSYAYAVKGEVWAASQAGHDPSTLFKHYREIATKKQGEQWFAVAPAAQLNVIPMTGEASA